VPLLVLGPLLRYVGETEATVWVETDAPCEVTVCDRTEPTFHVEGHNYALVYIEGLQPRSTTPYEVRLDGAKVWPDEKDGTFPPSLIRTPKAENSPPHDLGLLPGCRRPTSRPTAWRRATIRRAARSMPRTPTRCG
jgi:hypothetical protein